jgi:glycosyltransferase involved in cell wall biosynthesis
MTAQMIRSEMPSTRQPGIGGQTARPPRVSIIVPTFNAASFLKSTVKSIQAQTFGDWQLILSDDGSSDATVAITNELVESDARIISVKGTHGGPVVSRMRGFRRSDPGSEFVIFMDHDDTWEADALAVLVGSLDAAPECVAAYGLARGAYIDGRPFENDNLAESMRRRRVLRGGQPVELPPGARTSFEAMLITHPMVTFGTMLIRRSALDAVGGLEPSTAPADDWDLCVRLARKSDLLPVDQVILNWRRHPNALANTSKRWRMSGLVVRARIIQCPENSPQQRNAALEALLLDCRKSWDELVATVGKARWRETSGAVVFAFLTGAMYTRFRWFSRIGWESALIDRRLRAVAAGRM